MWAYFLRRSLLMIPTLFGISLFNFLLINSADAPRAGSMSADGVVDSSASAESGEAERIFRAGFNLDKPVLFNTRFGLDDDEIVWLLTTPMRAYSQIAEKKAARDLLEDYGRTIVPHLIRVGAFQDAIPAEIRESYEERWRDAREEWIAGDPPLDESIPWPPPEEAPAFTAEFRAALLLKTLDRLYFNAPRRTRALRGASPTEEDAAFNKEVAAEQLELRAIFDRTRGDDPDPEGAFAEWVAWYEPLAAEWDYSFGDKVEMFFFETRFAKFWDRLLSFDLGDSFIYRRPVTELIMERLPVSLTLAFGSLIIAYLIAIPLGILSGVTHGSLGDQIVTLMLFALYSAPVMFVGVLLRDYVSTDWKWLPGRGFESDTHDQMTTVGQAVDVLKHVILPMAALTLGSIAYYSRFMKAGLLEVIRADFIRTARAKGVTEFVVIMRHAVRNSLIPVVTLLGASLPVLIGGSVIVEVIFQINGMGLLGYDAVLRRDYSILLGVNLVAAVLTMVGVLLTDLLYAVLDPRIAYK